MSGVVVIHALGATDGGEPWARAFAAAGFDDVVVPDLPGHGAEQAPTGGNYVRAMAGFEVARLVAGGLDLSDRTVVGVGHGGWIASLLAIAGVAPRIVLVDGLGAPWTGVGDRMAARRATMRAILADSAAMAPHTGPGPDPRLAHAIDPHGDEALAIEVARLVAVPTLVLQADPSDVVRVSAAFAAATVVANDGSPAEVATAVRTWSP